MSRELTDGLWQIAAFGLPRTSGRDAARMTFELRRWAHEGLREHGCKLGDAQIDAILNKDFELNAAGLAAWLTREAN